MRTIIIALAFLVAASSAFSLSMKTDSATTTTTTTTGRRTFLTKTITTATAGVVLLLSSSTVVVLGGAPQAAMAAAAAAAAPEVKKTESGRIKYAILKPAAAAQQQQANDFPAQKGDIAAIEYTGYLTNGQIFDGTHAEGKKNILVFQVGGNAVIDGINEMVMEMGVGEKVQAIIPPELAFKDKGVCLPNGECLIKPGDTLVYDILLKRVAIPPP